MNQNELDMNLSQSRRDDFYLSRTTWSVSFERARFEVCHQSGYVSRCREWKLILLDVHLAILSSPRIDSSQPALMNMTDIGSGESVVAIVTIHQFFKRTYLFSPLDPIHLALTGDMLQILQYALPRARLKLVLVEIGRVVAMFTFQRAPPQS